MSERIFSLVACAVLVFAGVPTLAQPGVGKFPAPPAGFDKHSLGAWFADQVVTGIESPPEASLARLEAPVKFGKSRFIRHLQHVRVDCKHIPEITGSAMPASGPMNGE